MDPIEALLKASPTELQENLKQEESLPDPEVLVLEEQMTQAFVRHSLSSQKLFFARFALWWEEFIT